MQFTVLLLMYDHRRYFDVHAHHMVAGDDNDIFSEGLLEFLAALRRLEEFVSVAFHAVSAWEMHRVIPLKYGRLQRGSLIFNDDAGSTDAPVPPAARSKL